MLTVFPLSTPQLHKLLPLPFYLWLSMFSKKKFFKIPIVWTLFVEKYNFFPLDNNMLESLEVSKKEIAKVHFRQKLLFQSIGCQLKHIPWFNR
jgi:hypothetical protein